MGVKSDLRIAYYQEQGVHGNGVLCRGVEIPATTVSNTTRTDHVSKDSHGNRKLISKDTTRSFRSPLLNEAR